MSEGIIGIDLGTTNSAVGIVDSGFPILLADSEGNRVIPSAVLYGADGVVTVGGKALRQRAAGSGAVVTSVKRLIGRRLSEVDTFCRPIEQSENGELLVDVGEKKVTVTEVSSEILKSLKATAEERLGYAVNRAVVTVPAYFNDAQRAATKAAGELAGLTVERIVSEPTAAALAYGLDKLADKSRVVVYDLGGGTFDVSLLEMNNGVFQVIATSGDTHLGGDDIDELLAEYCWQQHTDDDFEVLDALTKQRIYDVSKTAKEKLSAVEVGDEVAVQIPFIREGENLDVRVSRRQFEKMISSLLQRTVRHCRQVMLDGKIANADLDEVILVGGSTRIPAVRELVGEFFGKEPDTSQHPDEAVALGAVIQGGIISGALRDIVLLDVTPLSLGIETFGGLMNVIIPRNTTIPCKAGEMFTNAVDGQSAVRVRVLQGEREMARDNWELGAVEVPFEPAAKGQARVGVQFSIDENGILEVLTRDVATGKDVILEIDSAAVDVADDKVEQMVSESVEFAFDDMAERVFTEAKLKAEELLPAVEVAISQVGCLLSKEEMEGVRASRDEVKAAMGSGEANRLKAAVQKLDKSTEYLATLLVEKAMEEALIKKLEEQ